MQRRQKYWKETKIYIWNNCNGLPETGQTIVIMDGGRWTGKWLISVSNAAMGQFSCSLSADSLNSPKLNILYPSRIDRLPYRDGGIFVGRFLYL